MISASGKKIGSHTAADYMEWDEMLRLVHCLYKDKEYVMSVFIGVGAFSGLRVSDIRELRWCDILSKEPISIEEKKTGKKRVIKWNKDMQEHVQRCYDNLKILNPNYKFLISQKKMVFSNQRLNVLLKEMKKKYKVKVGAFSNHTLRKTYGRKIYATAIEQGQGDMALILLMDIFNHSSPAITKRYLGIRQEELTATFDMLTF